MNNPNVRVIYGRRKTKGPEALGVVEVEYYNRPMRKRFSTGVAVAAKHWRNGVVRGRQDAPALNKIIAAKVAAIEKQAALGFTQTSDEDDPKNMTIPEWLAMRINQRTDITDSTRRQHLVMMRAVEACGLLKFGDITTSGIQRLEDHVRKHVKKQTSVYNYHKRLKPYLTIAERLGLIVRNPYRDIKTPHGVSDARAYLTEAERQAIEGLHLTSIRAKVRDMFILACYTGLSYVDLVRIDRNNVEQIEEKYYLVDYRHKTGAKYRLRLLPAALEILQRYAWKMNLACNQVCNRELKIIGLMAGINKNITMHVGRHTFATWALSKEVPIEVVSKMLAHSDIQTTQIYAKILQSSIDAGFDKLAKVSQR